MSANIDHDWDVTNRHLDRIATALEQVVELLANPKYVVAPPVTGPYYPATWSEPRPSHWPVTPAQPRDPRPSIITT